MTNSYCPEKIIIPLFLFYLLISISGCGYYYASDTKDVEKYYSNKQVQTVSYDSNKLKTLKVSNTKNTKKSPKKSPNYEVISPCGVNSFTIQLVNSKQRITKSVDCTTGQVLSMDKANVVNRELRKHLSNNLPTDMWYLLVDPTGRVSSYVSNEDLLKLSKYYKLDYFDHMAGTGLIVYKFDGSKLR